MRVLWEAVSKKAVAVREQLLNSVAVSTTIGCQRGSRTLGFVDRTDYPRRVTPVPRLSLQERQGSQVFYGYP